MTQSSTGYGDETVRQFHRDPTGLTVILADGSEVEVKRWEDTSRGRRLRCRGVRRWVSVREVVAVCWFVVSVRSPRALGIRK